MKIWLPSFAFLLNIEYISYVYVVANRFKAERTSPFLTLCNYAKDCPSAMYFSGGFGLCVHLHLHLLFITCKFPLRDGLHNTFSFRLAYNFNTTFKQISWLAVL